MAISGVGNANAAAAAPAADFRAQPLLLPGAPSVAVEAATGKPLNGVATLPSVLAARQAASAPVPGPVVMVPTSRGFQLSSELQMSLVFQGTARLSLPVRLGGIAGNPQVSPAGGPVTGSTLNVQV